ncbi:MAG: hypothetical protein U0232_20880 [Thermomicrobiales bacterium]
MCIRHRLLTCLLCITTLGAGLLVPIHDGASAAAEEQCFVETGYCVREPFLAYWQQHGGLAINGYPISGAFSQVLENGQSYTVQYFERVRMEQHPENAAPYDVLLGQFGRMLYLTDPGQPRAQAAPRMAGARYFDETGHNVRGKFLAYWEANGGLTQFGFPVSEELQETLENGQSYTVQYFERARFELHPENGAPYDVLLGQFGRRVLGAIDPPQNLPYIVSGRRGQIYRAEFGVRVRLMLPTSAEKQVVGVFQQFERGTMIWIKETKQIYVFAKDAEGYTSIGQWRVFTDTWEEGQDPGGGDAPSPNLYFPQRGFGKVWRDNPVVQQMLGYATTRDENLTDVVVQSFGGGAMIEILSGPTSGDYRYSQGIFAIYTNGRFEFRY